jgi:glutamate carboxypeptidase
MVGMDPAGFDPTDLLRRALADERAYLDTLRALVELESPTTDRAAGQRLADHLAARLEADGWAVEREPRAEVGDLLLARLEGGDPDDASLILAHYDTVWPIGTLAEMPWRRDGDRVHGPGVLDMKAGIATALHAARLARELAGPRGPVTLLISSDEETGSIHSREAIEREARRHARVLVVEPGRDDGALKVGRKGVGVVRVRFRGRSAHAGLNPEAGASALRELAHFLFFAEDLGDAEKGTTVNLTVASGGSAGNVVAEEAVARLDVRVLRMDEGERVVAALRGYRPHDRRVTVETSGGMNRPPMEATAENAALADEARAAASALGLSLGEAVVGGGSDGNFTSAMGVPTLDGLGAVGEGPHARHEHVRVRPTLERVALLTALLVGPRR